MSAKKYFDESMVARDRKGKFAFKSELLNITREINTEKDLAQAALDFKDENTNSITLKVNIKKFSFLLERTYGIKNATQEVVVNTLKKVFRASASEVSQIGLDFTGEDFVNAIKHGDTNIRLMKKEDRFDRLNEYLSFVKVRALSKEEVSDLNNLLFSLSKIKKYEKYTDSIADALYTFTEKRNVSEGEKLEAIEEFEEQLEMLFLLKERM